MSAFDTFVRTRDSVLANALSTRQEQRQNALDTSNMQFRQQQQDLLRQREEQEQAQVQQEQQLGALGAVAQGLHDLPAAERWSAFQRIAPRLANFGVGAEMLAGIGEADLNDGNLVTMMGLAGIEPRRSTFQNVGGGRIVEIAPDGSVSEAYAAPVDPLDRDLKQAQIEAQRALVGQRGASANAANARANRSRAGGSGRSSSGGSRPSAPARPISPQGIRWD